MARRAQPLKTRLPPAVVLPGGAALGVVAVMTLGASAVVALRAEDSGAMSEADWRAASFTVSQATLSAILSVALAVPVARALARRRFPGRETLTRLMGAPFLLPAVVAILGVIAVWGRSGWISEVLAASGFPRLNVYGMPGVLIAHVFFNLPLAVRLILQGYAAIPAERWRAAAQLGLEGRALWRAVEWPALRTVAPGALAAIFAICAASFAVALALGGGPRATTLELAIYEAAAYDFDLGLAARLALLQLCICAAAALAALALSGPIATAPGLEMALRRWDGANLSSKISDMAVLVAVSLFLGAPMAAVVAKGLAGLGELRADIWAAAGRSLAVALLSATMALAISAPLAALAAASDGWRSRLLEAASLAPIAASPFVLGIALFIVLRPIADPAALALPLTAVVNAVMAAPFATRILTPPLRQARSERGRLADSLGLRGYMRARVLYLPAIRAPLGFAAGLSAALSAGDLGVIALFSTPEAPTLPLLMHLLATSRRIDAAYGAALVLITMSFGLFWFFDRLGRKR